MRQGSEKRGKKQMGLVTLLTEEMWEGGFTGISQRANLEEAPREFPPLLTCSHVKIPGWMKT